MPSVLPHGLGTSPSKCWYSKHPLRSTFPVHKELKGSSLKSYCQNFFLKYLIKSRSSPPFKKHNFMVFLGGLGRGEWMRGRQICFTEVYLSYSNTHCKCKSKKKKRALIIQIFPQSYAFLNSRNHLKNEAKYWCVTAYQDDQHYSETWRDSGRSTTGQQKVQCAVHSVRAPHSCPRVSAGVNRSRECCLGNTLAFLHSAQHAGPVSAHLSDWGRTHRPTSSPQPEQRQSQLSFSQARK